MSLNPELADPVVDLYMGITDSQYRHTPDIIVPAICLINDAHMICLYNSKTFIGRASWHQNCLIACRQLDGYAQTDQAELTFFQLYILCAAQINPVAFTINIGKTLYFF